MLKLNFKAHRGDTLIEVLFAITIFSSVAVSSLSIMNQGASISQRALEITLVRQEMDSQAETLRYLNAAYVAVYEPGVTAGSYTGAAAQWLAISAIASGTTETSPLDVGASCPNPYDPSPSQHITSFIVNSHKATSLELSSANSSTAQTFSQVGYNATNDISSVNGIWIEAIKFDPATSTDTNQSTAGYIDFHIRACWDSPGQSVPMTLGTIVRLYEPVGGSTGISTPAPAITSTPTPTPPTVSVTPEAGNTATWSWPATDCSGKTPHYQYRYSYNGASPFTSDWLETSSTSVDNVAMGLPALTEGVTYTVDVQAQCYSATTISDWSGVGTKDYTIIIPIATTDLLNPDWIPGVAGTAMANKYVRNVDLSGTYRYKTSNNAVTSPQGSTNFDPNYLSNMSLVSPQTNPNVDFSEYPAQNACKAIGGRLPNMQELLAIHANKASYGNNFQAFLYWSSTEFGSYDAYDVPFIDGGSTDASTKAYSIYVRCVADHPNWIPGVAGTAMAGKYVRSVDLVGTYQYKVSNTLVASPQGATGLDPNYPSSMSLVSPQTNPNVVFSEYPAQNTCRSIGGRLPTVQELLAIYTDRASYGDNFVLTNFYLSSTEYLGNGDQYAQVVLFFNGTTFSYFKTSTPYVRCVMDNNWIAGIAGTAMAGKYVRNADLGGTYQYKVSNTGNIPPQGAIGLDPNNPSSMSLVSPQANPGVDFSEYPAQNACKAIGGRLPNMQELQAIRVDKALYSNNFQAEPYWSSIEYNYTIAYLVHFLSVTDTYYAYNKTEVSYVRCVAG